MADSKPKLLLAEVQGLVQSIAQFAQSTVFVYDEDDLQDKLKGATLPAVGVIYNGMRSLPESGTMRTGGAAELMFSLLLVQQGKTIVTTDTKPATIDLLDVLRGAILGVRSSTTGHLFRFVMEAPAQTSKGVIFWGQRWAVPMQLTPQKNNIP